MDNLLAILAIGVGGVVAGCIGAVFCSDTVRTEGLSGAFRKLHWMLSANERLRHPYRY